MPPKGPKDAHQRPVFLSVRQAAHLYGLSKSYLYLRMKEGAIESKLVTLPNKKKGKRLIITESLYDYIWSSKD